MKRLYIPWHNFWLRRRAARLFRGLLAAAVVLLSLALTAGLMTVMVMRMGGSSDTHQTVTAGTDARDRFNMHITNRLSDALEGVRAIEKVYWLSDKTAVAPEPDPACYGESSDPEVLRQLVAEAASLLEGQTLYFDPEGQRQPGSTVRYYLDETIFAVTWKEIHDSCVYTFSEVKIAHPSQFRRFLAGNQYGSAQQFLTTEMSASVNAVVASSGDFYGYRTIGAVVYGGTVYRSEGSLDLCLVDGQGDLRFLYAGQIPDAQQLQQFVADNDIRFSLAFGPVLVENGQNVSTGQYPVGENSMPFSRAALCQMDELHYLVAAANMENDYPMVPTLPEFARRIAETGCTMAYTLDGGQTAAIAMDDQLVNQVSYGSQRRISDIFYFATAIPDGG